MKPVMPASRIQRAMEANDIPQDMSVVDVIEAYGDIRKEKMLGAAERDEYRSQAETLRRHLTVLATDARVHPDMRALAADGLRRAMPR